MIGIQSGRGACRVRIHKGDRKMKAFNKHEFFCKKCIIHDTFFVGGASWAPDGCPECGGTECKMYMNLSFLQKAKAREKFDKMWKKKFNL